MTLLLTERDVQALLTMEMALEAVESAFRDLAAAGGNVNHPRRRIALKNGMLHYMASALPAQGVLGLKIYPALSGHISFLVPLYSTETGRLLALIEADHLGRMRTGAASGVATKYMARPESQALGLFGTGAQARTQLLAVCAVRPIEHVRVYGRSAEKRAEFVREMQPLVNARIEAVDQPRAAVEGADVVVTMTSSSQPVFSGEWLRPGTHVNAAGSNHLKRREIDGVTVARCGRIAVDMLEQAQLECGDLAAAVAEGLITWESVTEFAAIVGQQAPGRASADEITLFESHGLAAWDIATAVRVFELAVRRGVGREIPLFAE
jgi:ornithine cyclodeaminase/alanine dehydrogenase-like protein (mu-crystallin family)